MNEELEFNKDIINGLFGVNPHGSDLPMATIPDFGRVSNIDVVHGQKYLGTTLFDTPDFEEQVAKSQSWGAKFAGFLGQSLGEIAGGTIEGFGSMYQLIEDTISESANGDAEFDNLVIAAGRGIREGSKDLLPIYRENPNESFDMNDWGWWFSNGVSLASTVSMLIPARATTGAVGYLGKLAKFAKAADKISDTGKYIAELGTTAFVMRNAENYREAFEVTNKAKNEALGQLSVPENFDQWLLSEPGQEYIKEIGSRDISPENASDWIAAKAGWHTYKWNSANIVFDLVQSATLLRGLGRATRTNVLGGSATVRDASNLATSFKQKALRAINPILGGFKNEFTEGLEEGINFIGGKEGAYYGKELLNQDLEKPELTDRLGEYVKDGQLWEAFTWGIAGGAAFHGISNVMTKKQRGAAELSKLAEIQNRGQLIASFAKQKQGLKNQFDNGEISADILKEQTDDITSTLGFHLGVNAARNGNVDNLLEIIDSPEFQSSIIKNYSEEELRNLEIRPEELVNDVKNNILEAESQYKKFNNILFTNPASQAAKDLLLSSQLTTVADVQRHGKAIERLTDRYNNLVSEGSETDETFQHENFNKSLELAGLKLASEVLKNQTQKGTFPAKWQEKIQKQAEALEAKKIEAEKALEGQKRANLDNINEDLIEVSAALQIRGAYKTAANSILNELNSRKVLTQIDEDLTSKKEQKEKDDLQAFENDLNTKLVSDSLTEADYNNLLKQKRYSNSKYQNAIKLAKNAYLEKKKAEDLKRQAEQTVEETETVSPPFAVSKPIVSESAASEPTGVLPVKGNDVELESLTRKELGAIYTSFKENLDKADTVEKLNNLKQNLLNTRKLQAKGINEQSATIRLIDSKIITMGIPPVIETENIKTEEVVVEEPINVENQVVEPITEVNSQVANEVAEPIAIETKSESEKALDDFKSAFGNLAKAVRKTANSGVPLTGEVIEAGIELLKAGAKLGYATLKDIAKFAKSQFGSAFDDTLLRALKGAYAFADTTDSLPEGVKKNDDSVKNLTLKDLEEKEQPVQVIEDIIVGEANLFVLPLAFTDEIKQGDIVIGRKIKDENLEEARLIYSGNLAGTIELRIDSENSYHKNNIDEAAIEVYKDGKRTKIYLNTVPSIEKQIAVVKKIQDKAVKGQELVEQYYPELNRKIDEKEWVKENWKATLIANLEATKQIRNKLWTNESRTLTANLNIGSSGSIVNTIQGKEQAWRKASDLGLDVELFFTHPKLSNGGQELISTKGNNIIKSADTGEFNNGRIYVGVKGLNGKTIPARLKVNKLTQEDVNAVYGLIELVQDAIQQNATLDSSQIVDLREKISNYLIVNKFNDDKSTYFKIHQNRIEFTFGENREHTLFLNYKLSSDKGKTFQVPVTNGKRDVFAIFKLNGGKETLSIYKQKEPDKFEKAIKKALSQKLYNVDKVKLLEDNNYRQNAVENRLLTDVGGVYDSSNNLLGRVIPKQTGRIENAIFSVSLETQPITETQIEPETQLQTVNEYDDVMLFAVNEAADSFQTSTLEQKQENWSRMFGDKIPFDGNIAELIWTKGEWAYGVFRNAAVEVSQKAPRGTEYHEAFHVVSHLYLGEAKFQALLNEARKEFGEGLTDIQIEEELAKKFHAYSLMKDANKEFKGISGKIKQFFERIYNYIKNLLDYPTDYIFDKIYSGGFNYQPSEKVLNFAKKITRLSEVPDIEIKYTRREIDTFVNVLTRLSGEYFLRNQNLTKQEIISDPNNSLKNYVSGFLNNAVSKVTENQAKELNRRIRDFDEFWSLTKNNLDQKLNIQLDYDESIPEIGDELQKDWDDTKAFSRSGKESFSTELKMLIMTTPRIASYQEVGGKYSFVSDVDAQIGLTPALDFNKVYPYLQRTMSGSLDVNEMMSRLELLSKHEPAFLYLKNKLESNNNLKNAWFFNFNKPLTNFHYYQIIPVNGKTEIRFDISNKSNTYIKLANSWIENIKTKLDSNYYTKERGEEARSLINQINLAKNNGDIQKITELTTQLFSLVGINISNETIMNIVSNPMNVRFHNGLIPSYRENLEIPLFNLVKNLFNEDKPVFNNIGDLNNIAFQYQYFTYEGQENSFANTEGSIMFGFNNPNFLSNFFKQLKAATNTQYANDIEAKTNLFNLLKEYASDSSLKYSNWLWDTGNGGMLKLVDGQKNVNGLTINHINYQFIKNIELYTFDGLKNRISGDGQRYADLSDEDWKLTKVLDYLSASKYHDFITIPIVIQSDSGNSHAIKVPNNKLGNKSLEVNGNIFEAIKNVFRQEVLRMKQAADLMFDRNPDGTLKVKDSLDIGQLQNIYHYKLDKAGKPVLIENGMPTGNVFKFQTLKYVESGITKNLNDIDDLFYHGIVNLGNNNTLAPSVVSQVNSHISNFIKAEIEATKNNLASVRETVLSMSDNSGKSLLAYYSNNWDNFVSEFALNQYIANIEQQNFFTGYSAEYKNAVDTNKRAKEITSPIVSGNIEELGDTYQAVILSDIKLQSSVLDNMIEGLGKELKKNYSKYSFSSENIKNKKPDNELEKEILDIVGGYMNINSTDAQGYISLERYEKILRSYGRMYEDTLRLLEKVKSGEQINPNDYSRLLVPLKPFYYGRHFDNYTGKMQSRQVKLSVFPLIPNLIKGSELETIATAMQSKKIDEIYFESAVKVGASNITKITDKNGNLVKDFDKSLKPQTFFNRFWGLQLDVVSHTKDAENKLGVQLAKILPSGLSKESVYTLNEEKKTGDEIRTEWQNVLSAHIESEAKSLLKRLGATLVDGKYRIEANSQKVQEILLQELKSRNLAQNYSDAIAYNIRGEFNLPLFYSAMATKFESLLSSLFKNNVTDLKTAGSHLVLGSTAFLTKVKISKPTETNIGEYTLEELRTSSSATSKSIKFIRKDSKNPTGYFEEFSNFTPSSILIKDEFGLKYKTVENFYQASKSVDINVRKQFQNVNAYEAKKLGRTVSIRPDWESVKYNVMRNGLVQKFADQKFKDKLLSTGDLEIIEWTWWGDTVWGMSTSSNRGANALGKLLMELRSQFRTPTLFDQVESNIRLSDTGIEWSQEVVDRGDYNLKSIQYNKDGSISAEVLMPRWTKKFFKDSQPININELPEKARTFVMNRIPTESKHSIIVLKAVGFLPSEMDALMIAPDDIVAMMGSDFDVDSGYNWHYNLETKDDKVSVIEYDNSKSPLQNSKRQRENRLLDLAVSIMLSSNTFVENVTSSSFEDMTRAKNELNDIRGINTEGLDPASGNTQDYFRSAVIAGRALKGLAASYNGILPVFQDINAQFKLDEDNQYSGFVVKYSKHELDVDKVKSRYKDDVLDETNSTITIRHRFVGNSPINDYQNVIGKHLTTYSSQTLSNVLDIVKEGIPPGLNTYTFGVFQSLLAVGSTIDYASRIVDQPIINYLTNIVSSSESILASENFSPITKTRNKYQTELFKTLYRLGHYENNSKAAKHVQYLTKAVKNEFGFETGRVWDNDKMLFLRTDEVQEILNYDPNSLLFFTNSELENNIKDSIAFKSRTNLSNDELQSKVKYLIKQLQVLNLFANYRDLANDISNNMRLLSFDKIASSPSLGVTPQMNIKMNGISSNLIDGRDLSLIDSVYGNKSSYPILKSYWDWSNKLSFDIFSNLFIKYSASFVNSASALSVKLGKIDENLINKFNSYLVSLSVSKLPFFENLDSKRILGVDSGIIIDENVSLEDFSKLSVANKIFLLKGKNFSMLHANPNHILNYLEPKLSKDSIDRNGFQKIDINKPAPSEQLDNYISDSITQMYFSNDKFMKDLAQDLIKYSYLTNGLTFGKDSFANYIPEFVLNQAMNLGDELRNIHKMAQNPNYFSDNFPEYIDYFIRNNWHDKNIVPRVATKLKKIEGQLVIDEALTESAGQEVFKTEKGTAYWELSGDFIVIKEEQLKSEDRNIQRAEYVLLNQRINGELKSMLMKRFDNMGVEYTYYPVPKLGNIHLRNELSENSVLPSNNTVILQSVYEYYFDNLNAGITWEQVREDFYSQMREEQENNNKINCKI